ncbi:MAG: hypothetical protein NDF54_12360 [archaeon GB-1867-035]|nr:hypothetical protein [Candidatus Culexmicrobium profundum]
MGQYKILQRYKLDIKRKRQLPKSKKVTLTSDQIKKIISDLDEKYFYHWYDEPLNVRLEIKSEVLKKLLDNLVKKYKAKSYRDLLQRTFNIPIGKANTILDWLKNLILNPK